MAMISIKKGKWLLSGTPQHSDNSNNWLNRLLAEHQTEPAHAMRKSVTMTCLIWLSLSSKSSITPFDCSSVTVLASGSRFWRKQRDLNPAGVYQTIKSQTIPRQLMDAYMAPAGLLGNWLPIHPQITSFWSFASNACKGAILDVYSPVNASIRSSMLDSRFVVKSKAWPHARSTSVHGFQLSIDTHVFLDSLCGYFEELQLLHLTGVVEHHVTSAFASLKLVIVPERAHTK